MLVEFDQKVQTVYGNILVNIYGDRNKHPILTFHDIGLNAQQTFRDFFQFLTVEELGGEFCIYNVNAPGQQKEADTFPSWYNFPTMDEMVTMIHDLVQFFNLKSFIGLGIGAGANLLLRYAAKHQEKVDGLILINCVYTKANWTEWGYQNLNASLLKNIGPNNFTTDYLLWHHLGTHIENVSQTKIKELRHLYNHIKNPVNLAGFIESYVNRTHVHVTTKCHKDPNFTVPVLQIVGEGSAFLHEAEHLNSMLDHKNSELVKFAECGGDVLNERPDKATEAILLFLQGCGYFPWLNVRKVVKKIRRTTSEEETTISSNEDDATTRSIRGSVSDDFGYFYDGNISPIEPNIPRVF
uniref:Uncharacterized protein n=1 Tax=Acrobeloides nanus TaxID=290746 RepID=A0A914DNF2_9BILA